MAELEGPQGTETPSKTITRRRFILGVIAGGAAVGAASYRFLAPAAHGRNGGERLITLMVNGKPRHVEVMKQETLAFTLRYKLGLTGTKLGCDRAECGACTVLLDDVPHYSCSVLTHTVRGRQVTTIEGLAHPDGTLHPVQQAVIDQQGFQCAFCMSGFIMSAVGFLKTNPNPTRQELAHGISGNLCRCQDYSKILDAMMLGADYARKGTAAHQIAVGPTLSPKRGERMGQQVSALSVGPTLSPKDGERMGQPGTALSPNGSEKLAQQAAAARRG
jgi:aerobic-type carbon monoxide dehydrogenase small subunit (CoxS/CutS family)